MSTSDLPDSAASQLPISAEPCGHHSITVSSTGGKHLANCCRTAVAEFNPATGELRIQNAVEAVRMEPRDPDMPYKSDPSALTPIEVEEKRQYMNRLATWSLVLFVTASRLLAMGHLQSIQGLPSIMPHDIDFSCLFKLLAVRRCGWHVVMDGLIASICLFHTAFSSAQTSAAFHIMFLPSHSYASSCILHTVVSAFPAAAGSPVGN